MSVETTEPVEDTTAETSSEDAGADSSFEDVPSDTFENGESDDTFDDNGVEEPVDDTSAEPPGEDSTEDLGSGDQPSGEIPVEDSADEGSDDASDDAGPFQPVDSSDSDNSDDEEPPAEEPTDEEPGPFQPVDSSEEPPAEEPTDEEPGPFQPVDSSEEPPAEEPTDEEPGPFQPVDSSEEPPAEEPTDEEPGPFQPVDSSEPSVDSGAADDSGADHPFSQPVSQPVTGGPAVEPLEPAWLAALPTGPVTPSEKTPLTIIPEPAPAERKAPFVISFRYDPSVTLPAKPLPAAITTICSAMERLRDDVGVISGLNPQVPSLQLATSYWQRGYMRNAHTAKPDTNLDPAAALAQVGLSAGPSGAKATVDELVKLWRTLSGVEGDCAAINAYDNANLTWGTGFAAAGHAQSALRRALKTNDDLRRLLHAAGMSVQPVKIAQTTRLMFFAVDTAEGWVLRDNDAERYIRNDPRLLTLLIRVAEGTVPDALLPDTPKDRNEAMRWASANAQFIEFIAAGSAGHVPPPAWGAGWTPELRAGVAHNIHFGAVPTDWTRYAATGGDPFKIIQEMVWGTGSPTQVQKSADARFNGHFGHRGFLSALPLFAPKAPSDPPDSRYIDIKGLGTLLVPPLKPKP